MISLHSTFDTEDASALPVGKTSFRKTWQHSQDNISFPHMVLVQWNPTASDQTVDQEKDDWRLVCHGGFSLGRGIHKEISSYRPFSSSIFQSGWLQLHPRPPRRHGPPFLCTQGPGNGCPIRASNQDILVVAFGVILISAGTAGIISTQYLPESIRALLSLSLIVLFILCTMPDDWGWYEMWNFNSVVRYLNSCWVPDDVNRVPSSRSVFHISESFLLAVEKLPLIWWIDPLLITNISPALFEACVWNLSTSVVLLLPYCPPLSNMRNTVWTPLQCQQLMSVFPRVSSLPKVQWALTFTISSLDGNVTARRRSVTKELWELSLPWADIKPLHLQSLPKS